ncbi:hypothetical protein [Methylobacillus flagellatus]|uniref:hypothetical protein n=1 Tax=Methylobacillus flagellatus TaxID=405 RepID=UPI0010F9996C|nr:hypothetical protein [Methylobacillus flagellatus]
MLTEIISIVGLVGASLSALYSRWAVNEAKKANDIGRLNSLLSFRVHYLDLMRHQEKMADVLKNSASGMQKIREEYADLDAKLREITSELDCYYSRLINHKA